MKRSIFIIFLTIVASALLPACIEDSFTTSPSDQPAFSADTLRMGETFTLAGTPTSRFTVYNRSSKMLNISSIGLREGDEGIFRLNVDGISGRTFQDVEIRPNDSIFVFVEATLPENGSADALEMFRHLDFITNGVKSTVVIDIVGQDAIRLRDVTLTENTTFTAGRPYIIYDTLRVAEGVTLTIEPGARLRMHDKAAIKVSGTLSAIGTPQQPIEIKGDRDGFVAAAIPYELMSGQWGGIYFTETSRDNEIYYASIRNSSDGLTLAPAETGNFPALTLVNSQIRNTTNYIIDATHANVAALGCELADASQGIVKLHGGTHLFSHCTFANYYLFTALGGPTLQFEHITPDEADESGLPLLSADFSNSIIYGNGELISHGDLTGTGVYLQRCLLGVTGQDDENFIGCLWDSDPLYYTVREEYLFDYRLQPESPAIAAADPALDIFGLDDDFYGQPRGATPDLGAYVFVAPPAE